MSTYKWAKAGALVTGAGLIAASVGLGFWFAAVNTACEKPYRDDLGDIISGVQACTFGSPHAGLFAGEMLLIIITGVVGLAGLVVFVSSLVALFSKLKTPQDRRADFDRKVAETKARDAARETAAQRQHQEKMQAAASELAGSVAPIQLPRLGLAIHDGIIYVGGIRRDIRPLGTLTGSHATFTQLRDKPPKQHGLTYEIAIGLYSGPTPRGAVTVTAGSKTHHREVEGAMAVRQIHAEADRHNAFAEGAAWRGRAAQP
jgi:hypothetical protein